MSIAPDSEKNLKKMDQYPMRIISDLPKGKISREYNCFKITSSKKKGKIIKTKDVEPFSYLIDSNGIIKWIFKGTKEIRPTNEILKEAINTL